MNLRCIIIFFIIICFGSVTYGDNNSTIDSLEISLTLESDPGRKVIILLLLAEELKSSNPETALIHARHALDISLAAQDDKSELVCMNVLSEICFAKTELKQAMDYAVRAKMIAESMNDLLHLGRALYNMGSIYSDLGNYERSSELYYESLKLTEETGDQVTKAKVLNSIGIVHHNQNNYEKALEYYEKALFLAREINFSSGISKGLNNVAAIYGIWGEYSKVLEYLRDAISLNQRTQNMDQVGVNYLNFGYYFEEIGQYDSSIFYYDKALKIYLAMNNTSSIISARYFLAEYYFNRGNLLTSKQIASTSLEEARRNRLKRLEYEFATLLTKIHFQQKDSIQGYQYQVLELQMKDSLNIEQSRTRMSMLELQYALEKESEKKKAVQQRKDLINIIVVITLIFIIIVIVLLLSRMRIKSRAVLLEKDKLEMNLELRNKELTTNVMAIMKKNETLSQIANKLKGVQKEAVKDETKLAIRKISRELNRAVEEEPWEEFEMRFQQVHSEFYNKLIGQFPNLSPHEQRLCAFLRLNMTSKEISEITGQRISTIEMARTRLRKKLGITNTQTNLITFLTQI